MALQMIPDFMYQLISNGLTLIFATVGVLLFMFGTAFYRHFMLMQRCNKIPGPPAQVPFLGSFTEFFVEPEKMLPHLLDLYKKWSNRSVMRLWMGPIPIFVLGSAESVEVILGSNKTIDKASEYRFLHPWLGTGLLTSTGTKWSRRRKMLTPAFHFKILEDFVHVFNEQSAILVSKLNNKLNQDIDIFPYITACTLDIICDTAMGRHVNAQEESDSEYVQAVYKMSRIVQARQTQPWMRPDWLFNLLPYGAEQKRCLSILHNFTDQVIRERKIEHKLRMAKKELQSKNEVDEYCLSKKPRLAFLDLLIETSQEGKELSDLDIREEVDTFMFEGHDTTAAAISWSLFLIGNHPKAQEQVNEELNRVFGDSDRPITMADLNELKYLECCIKEALRLYPSVPFLGRQLTEDTNICGYDIPARPGSIMIVTYFMHRDPSHFPDPDSFQPERFFPENSRGRHPYAYVPFSAGPRNCIGQKFALMEEKSVLASVLRNFHVEALDKPSDIALLAELILRPRDGIRLRLSPKKNKVLS